MRTPYQLWRYWVERQKGPVTEALLRQPDQLEGLKRFDLLMRFTRHSDFGHFLTGDLRGYCKPSTPNGYTPVPGSCRHVLRYAHVPSPASGGRPPNPVAEWTRTHFDAPALTRHFRAIGLGPDTEWWGADLESMFAAAPSPQAMLAENAVIVRVDSTECPQMEEAI